MKRMAIETLRHRVINVHITEFVQPLIMKDLKKVKYKILGVEMLGLHLLYK